MAGICAYAAVHHLLLSARRPVDRTHFIFGVLCVLAALFFVYTLDAYRAESSQAIITARRWEMSFGMIFVAVLPWFVANYCRLKHRLVPALLSGYLCIVLIIHLLHPYGLEVGGPSQYRYMVLPWGEVIADIRPVALDGWHYAWWVGLVSTFAYAIHACLRQSAGHESRRSRALLLGIAFFTLCIVLQFAVNHRWIEFANLGEFGVLALILQMSFALTREMRETERRLQLVVDNVPAAIYLKDAMGRYLLVNKACERYLGKSFADLAGRTDHDLFPARQADQWRTNDAFVMRGGHPIEFEETLELGAQGPRVYNSLKAPLAYEDGTPYAICGVSVDVTKERANEEEMRQVRRQLWHSDRVARTGAMAASLAHELNQPLAAILHNAQAAHRLLQKGNRDWEQIDEILADIIRDDKRAAAVINELRVFVRQDEPAREPVDLSAVVHELLDLLHAELVKQKVRVDYRIDDTGTVLANRTQIQQILLNLVMNAIDAMQEQSAEERRLQFAIDRLDGGLVRVAVRDNGKGIAPDSANRVFDAFWTSKKSGMGLGLAICRSIVEAHGGTIQMLPNDDHGVTVAFTLPRGAAPGAA